MSEQTLKFNDAIVNKKEFHAFKQAVTLSLVDTDNIVVSDKYNHSDNGSKYFIGYLDHSDNGSKYFIGYLDDNDGNII